MSKKWFFITPLLFLFGCNLNPTYSIKLTQDTYEYENNTFDVCQFIESIDDIEIREFNREKNKIEQGDFSVHCPTLTIKELGKQEVIVQVNNIDIPVHFVITDSIAPDIHIDKSEYQVEEGNEYFNLEKLITVTDKYDKFPAVGYSGEYDLQRLGEYVVTVSAKDKSGNSSSKDIKIVVTEKEVEVIEKEVIVYGGNANSGSSTVNGGGVVHPKNPVGQNSLPPKTFLFANGYDMNSGFSACKEYRDNASASGRCSPLRDTKGITYGYEYTP